MVYNILKQSLISVWPSLTIVIVTILCLRFAYSFRHKDSFVLYKEFWTLVSVVYLFLLYQMVTNTEINTMTGINLVPFREILRYDLNSRKFFYNVIGNIVLFIPFGYIVSSYIKPKKVWSNLIIAIIVSATIEFVQLNIGRCFDIDDIILNTLGCVLGYFLYIGLNAIKRHLPSFLRSKWFNNLICIIIFVFIIISILKFWGIEVL